MTHRTVSLRHHGARVIGPVETIDAYCRDLGTAGRTSRTVRDAVLEATSCQGLLRLGRVFEGGESARLNIAAAEVQRLTTPLTDPRIGGGKLTAEPVPGDLDLGLVFDGLEAIRKAEETSNAEMRDTLRRQGLEMLERAIADCQQRRARAGSCTRDWAGDFFARSQANQDGARAALVRGEAEVAGRRLGGNPTADAQAVTPPKGPVTNSDLNQLHAEFWAKQAQR